jgi:hypothetical protein
MHVRGKSMEIRAVYPSGEKEVLLRVPQYDFNWQLVYEPAIRKRLPLVLSRERVLVGKTEQGYVRSISMHAGSPGFGCGHFTRVLWPNSPRHRQVHATRCGPAISCLD